MKIGFNYWMVVVPALYVLGCVVGYWSVWPGKKKALRRPFHWRSDVPIVVLTLLYGIVVAATTTVLLFVESRFGLIKLMERDDPASVFLMPVVVAFSAIATGLGTICSMAELRLWHKKRLVSRWAKQQMEKRRSISSCSGKVIAMPTRRRRRKFYQVWSDFKSSFCAKVRKKKERIWPSQMTLPEKVVRGYRRG